MRVWKVTASPVPWLPLANAREAVPGFLRTESWDSQASTGARVQVVFPVSGFTLDAFTEGPLELALPARGHPRGGGASLQLEALWGGSRGYFPTSWTQMAFLLESRRFQAMNSWFTLTTAVGLKGGPREATAVGKAGFGPCAAPAL